MGSALAWRAWTVFPSVSRTTLVALGAPERVTPARSAFAIPHTRLGSLFAPLTRNESTTRIAWNTACAATSCHPRLSPRSLPAMSHASVYPSPDSNWEPTAPKTVASSNWARGAGAVLCTVVGNLGCRLDLMCGWRGSNPRPPRWQRGALPAAPHPRGAFTGDRTRDLRLTKTVLCH